MTARTAPNTAIACALAFVAAWTDTVGFVALFGLFTAHVTGNFVVIGAAIVASTDRGIDAPGLAMRIAALPVFALGVAAMTIVVRRRQRAGRPSLRFALSIEALLLAIAVASGYAALPIRDADDLLVLVAAAAAVLAMGAQNAIGRLLLAQLSATTVMTVNVAQLMVDVVDLVSDRRGTTPLGRDARARAARIAPPVVVFAISAIAAAFAYRAVGFGCLAAPVVVLFTLVRFVPPA